MKIAYVVGTFPPNIGGMGAVVFDAAQGMAARGNDVTVFTLAYPNSREMVTSAFRVVRLRPVIMSGDAGWVPQLFFKLRGFDIVHLHYPFYGGAEWVWLASLVWGSRYVVTYHMDAAPTQKSKKYIQHVYDFFLAKTIIGGAQRMCVVDSDHAATLTFATTFRAKQVTVPNGIDTNIFKPQLVSSRDVGLPEWSDKKIILFVGNLLPVKRLELVLATIRDISDPNVVLLVVGGGYDEVRYKKMVEHFKISDRVKFVGVCREKEMLVRYYAVATCTVIPSAAESFSLVALEAMAVGCPVIASDIPGLRSKVRDGIDGFLFDPSRPEQLTTTIQKFLAMDMNERVRFGERGRVKVVDSFSLDLHLNRLERLYATVLKI